MPTSACALYIRPNLWGLSNEKCIIGSLAQRVSLRQKAVKHPTNAAAQMVRSIDFASRLSAWVSCTKARKQITDINSKTRPRISNDLRGVSSVGLLSIDPYDSLGVTIGEGFFEESENEMTVRQIIANGI